MGRSILIADGSEDGTGFAYNTLVFEAIVEGTRLHFANEERSCLQRCFEDLDENGMDYICLYNVNANDFTVFCRACDEGLRTLKSTGDVVIDYVATHQEVSGISALWQELIDVLRQDPRFEKSRL